MNTTPFALLGERSKSASDANPGQRIRENLIAGTTTAGGLAAGGASALLARVALAARERSKHYKANGIRPPIGPDRMFSHFFRNAPTRHKLLAASLIPLFGAAGFGVGQGANAGIDALQGK